MYLFDIAAQQGRWLAIKQATIATNVSNANTPGFRAQDVQPFEQILDKTKLALEATQPGHIQPGATDLRSFATKASDPWDVTHSGNSVSLEQEMLKAGDVNRTYALNTSVVKAFHRMYLASLKG
jgi:flagellar basal-body rod protein FlgB